MRLGKEARRTLALALAKQCRKGEVCCPVNRDCPFADIACALVNADDWEGHVRFSVKKKEERREQMG